MVCKKKEGNWFLAGALLLAVISLTAFSYYKQESFGITGAAVGLQEIAILDEATSTTCGTVSSSLTLTTDVNSTDICFNITTSNVVLDCDNYQISFSLSMSGTSPAIVSSGTTNVTVKNCKLMADLQNMGMLMSATGAINYFNVTNGQVSNNNITLANNSMGSNSYYAMLFNEGSGNNFSRNIINTGITISPAVYFLSSNNGIIAGNVIFMNTSSMMGGGGSAAIYLSTSSGFSINNNNITSISQWDGIYMMTSQNNIITNNRIDLTGGTSPGKGINIVNGCDNNLLENNTILSISGEGIYIDSVSNQTLRGNRINNSGAAGIFISTAYDMDYTPVHYNHTIDTTNLVEGLPVFFNHSLTNLEVFNNVDLSTTYGQLICSDCTNVTYNNITLGGDGILFISTNSSKIQNSNITATAASGVYLYDSDYNNLTDNTVSTSGSNNSNIIISGGVYSPGGNVINNNV
ncbi:MAG: right-handed parallel beta-helix repeat-containing protein, partial [Candidatus Woesearchaeota archaeon]